LLPPSRALSPKRQQPQLPAIVSTPRKKPTVIDLSSPDNSPSRSFVPKKRLSSEHGGLQDPSSPSSKRARREQTAEKENRFTADDDDPSDATLFDTSQSSKSAPDTGNVLPRMDDTDAVASPSENTIPDTIISHRDLLSVRPVTHALRTKLNLHKEIRC
jgi:hypothetical protein